MGNPQFRIQASQIHSIYVYRNWNIKVLSCNADMFYNKESLANKIIPNNAMFKFPTFSRAAVKAKNKAPIIRIKEEIKFLCQRRYNEKKFYTVQTSKQKMNGWTYGLSFRAQYEKLSTIKWAKIVSTYMANLTD